jgi:hypothetical protein
VGVTTRLWKFPKEINRELSVRARTIIRGSIGDLEACTNSKANCVIERWRWKRNSYNLEPIRKPAGSNANSRIPRSELESDPLPSPDRLLASRGE